MLIKLCLHSSGENTSGYFRIWCISTDVELISLLTVTLMLTEWGAVFFTGELPAEPKNWVSMYELSLNA